MIVVTTGAPGSGKTLLTIDRIRQLAEKDNRPVFYNGIKGLKLPWTEFDKAEDWWQIARDNPGAIIAIDECQRAFRPRAYGDNVPRHVEELETHRHTGTDLYLITQHPMLLHTNVRRLVGLHRHVVRAFGTHAATVHEWHNGGVKEQCDKPGSRDDSVKAMVKYPVDVFKLYESAEVHTHKRSIPKRVWVLLLIPLLVVVSGWVVSRWFGERMAGAKKADAPVASAQHPIAEAQAKTGKTPPISRTEWLQSFEPRLPGLPHTAPRYDALTAAVTAPVPVMCVATPKRCSCYSQQGTPMRGIDVELCRTIATDGYFLDFNPGTDPRAVSAPSISKGGEQAALPTEGPGLPVPGHDALPVAHVGPGLGPKAPASTEGARARVSDSSPWRFKQ
ncbi:MAG TPA: zonular occludens toxin domain-containing protein [Burkholderiales bacterium]|nr:zonular occludens toxin domain-containing protein [Burkholderiales bacterium]